MASQHSNVINLDRNRLTGVVSKVVELHAKFSLEPSQFWAIVDTLPVAVMIGTDRECSQIEGNVAARLLLRSPPGQNLSRSAPERELPAFEVFIDDKAVPARELPMQKAAATGKPAPRAECELRFADGSRAFIDGYSVPIFASNGDVCGSIGVFADVTPVKTLEEQNRRLSEEVALKSRRDALLLDIARMIIVDGEGKAGLTRRLFEKVGPHLEADFCFDYRYDPADRRLTLLAGPGLPLELRPEFETLHLGDAYCGLVAATGLPFTADASLLEKDPRGALIRKAGVRAYACHPLIDSTGQLLGTLSFGSKRRASFTADEAAFLQTICQYVALSWERYRVRAHALERERQLRIVTNAATVFIAYYDRNARYKFVNRAYAERFGMTPEEFPGQSKLDVVGKKAFAILEPYIKRCLGGETLDFEVELPYPDKVSRCLRCYYVPDWREGRIDGFVATIVDVTDRRRAEEAVRKSAALARIFAASGTARGNGRYRQNAR